MHLIYDVVSTQQPNLLEKWVARYFVNYQMNIHNPETAGLAGTEAAQPMVQIDLSELTPQTLSCLRSQLSAIGSSTTQRAEPVPPPAAVIPSHPREPIGVPQDEALGSILISQGGHPDSSLPPYILPSNVRRNTRANGSKRGRGARFAQAATVPPPIPEYQLKDPKTEAQLQPGFDEAALTQTSTVPIPISGDPQMCAVEMPALGKEPPRKRVEVAQRKTKQSTEEAPGMQPPPVVPVPEDTEFDINVFIYDSRKCTSEARSFTCNFPGCGRSFTDRSNLMTHIRKHTQERPFVCPKCNKRFSHKSTLRDHENSHTGEQPYQCPKCLRSFSQKSNLQRHSKIHSGAMPYKCSVCDRAFNQSSNLKTHFMTKHPNVEFVPHHL